MTAFRLATALDVSALASLYRDTARTLGPQVYSPEQVRAWASSPDDTEHFAHYILDARTWIADDGLGVAGFCGIALHDDGALGEVHSLYVRADRGRQGLGTRLLAHALSTSDAARCEAWATPFSKPVFERAGFVLARAVVEPYQGVLFERYRMVRGAVSA